MTYPRTIDFHMHTTVSDGTDSPSEILERVKNAGITCFSVTDHDAIKGCATIKSILKEGDPSFIYGVEFSCEDEDGKYHILGYGYEQDGTSINDLARYCHDIRIEKVKTRIDFLCKEYGFVFDGEDVDNLLALNNPGKPHIANLMIKYGYTNSINDAFKNYLNKFRGKNQHVHAKHLLTISMTFA